MTPPPWLCKAGARLRSQVDAAWPGRDTAADGWVGDASHSNRVSDHNPDPLTGVVRALDIDADGIPAQALADALAASRAPRLAYIVHDGRITSARSDPPWSWRPYSGTDPHRSHVHVSFTAAGDYDHAPWPLPEEGDTVTADEVRQIIREELARFAAEKVIADDDSPGGLISRDRCWYRAYSQGRFANLDHP